MTVIDSNVLTERQRATATRQKKIDLTTLRVGAWIKVVSNDGIPFYLEIKGPREGKVHLICDSGDKEVREDIANADLGQCRVYFFQAGCSIRSSTTIEEGGQLWLDTFLCFWVGELYTLE